MKKLLFALSLAALCGCVETAGTHVTINTDTGNAQVLECSMRLADRISVTRVTYRDLDGLRSATVTLESLTHYRQTLQARMIWLDAEGTAIDPDGKPYRTLVLDGKEPTTFTGVAPRPECVTARLQVREI